MIIPKKLNSEILSNYIQEKYIDIELNSKYQNGSTMVEVKCKIDDHKWNVFPRDIYSDTNMSCPECNRRDLNIQIKQQFQYDFPGLKIITRDIFSNTKIFIRCEDRGHVFHVWRKDLIGNNITSFNEPIILSNIDLLKNRKKILKCGECEIEDMKRLFFEISKSRNVTIVGEYKNNTTPVRVRCNKCGNEYGVVPKYYISKIVSTCKFCKTKRR